VLFPYTYAQTARTLFSELKGREPFFRSRGRRRAGPLPSPGHRRRAHRRHPVLFRGGTNRGTLPQLVAFPPPFMVRKTRPAPQWCPFEPRISLSFTLREIVDFSAHCWHHLVAPFWFQYTGNFSLPFPVVKTGSRFFPPQYWVTSVPLDSRSCLVRTSSRPYYARSVDFFPRQSAP